MMSSNTNETDHHTIPDNDDDDDNNGNDIHHHPKHQQKLLNVDKVEKHHPNHQHDDSFTTKKFPTDANLWRRLAKEAIWEIRPLAIATFSLIASTSCNQALFGLLSKLLNQSHNNNNNNNSNNHSEGSGSSTNSTSTLTGASSSLLLRLVLVAVGGGLASFIRTMSVSWVQDRITSRLRTRALQSLLTERDLEWFILTENISSSSNDETKHNDLINNNQHQDKNSKIQGQSNKNGNKNIDETIVNVSKGMTPGAIGTILDVDVPQVSRAVSTSVTNGIRSCCSCLFGTYRMIMLNPTLVGTSVGLLPAIGIIAATLNKIVKKWKQKQIETAALATAFCEERLFHIAMVKMSNREQDEICQYQTLQDEYVRVGQRKALADGLFMGFLFTAGSGTLFLIFHLGGRSVASGRMTSGQLAMFGTNSFMLALGTAGMIKAWSQISESLLCARRVYQLIDGPQPPQPHLTLSNHGEDGTTNTTAASTTTTTSSGTSTVDVVVDVTKIDGIRLDNVTFAYQSHPNVIVLRGVSMELTRGKIVALVGKNGSGKTTLASLLSAMYVPTSGQIVIRNGTLYHNLDRKLQKQLVQMVPQEPVLFDTTILENVRYSQPMATESEIWNALKLANAHDFISKLPQGLLYRVGPHGTKLSSGQRQRLGLARALLSDPPILILDEPQTSLDADGESAVMDAIQACRRHGTSNNMNNNNNGSVGDGDGDDGRALLLITHNANSLRHVDEIIVLQEGQVVERGSFDELTTANPQSKLCQLMPTLIQES